MKKLLGFIILISSASYAGVNGGGIETSCPTCSPIPDATLSDYVLVPNLKSPAGTHKIETALGGGTDKVSFTFNNSEKAYIDEAGDMYLDGNILADNVTGTCSGTNTGDQTITLTGAVTGSGSGSFSTIITNSSITSAKIDDGTIIGDDLANDSIALGSKTTGNYVSNVTVGGSNLSISGSAGEGWTPNISLSNSPSFSGNISALNFSGSSSGTNTGDQTVSLTGDVVGSGTGSFSATIQSNSVALGTDTTGNYISTVTAGTNMSVSGSGSETASVTVNVIADPAFTTVKLSISSSLGTCDSSTEGTIKYYNHSGSGKKSLCICEYNGLLSNVYGWNQATANGNCT